MRDAPTHGENGGANRFRFRFRRFVNGGESQNALTSVRPPHKRFRHRPSSTLTFSSAKTTPVDLLDVDVGIRLGLCFLISLSVGSIAKWGLTSFD
jgi:hypothetical protein